MIINTTLKNIRIEKGLTQEQVADKIGLTRQAISAYESGKRQPGLDILLSLADLYNVELEEILYGTKKPNNNRIIRITATILAVIFLLLQNGTFILRSTAQAKYPFKTGIVEFSQYDDLEKRNELYRVSAITESLSETVLLCGSFILCIMDLCLKTTYNTKLKIVCIAGFSALITLNSALWTCFFPEFVSIIDTLRYSVIILIHPILLFILNIAINAIISFRKKHFNKNQN